MRNGFQDRLAALDHDLEFDVSRLVTRHQLGDLRAQARGDQDVAIVPVERMFE